MTLGVPSLALYFSLVALQSTLRPPSHKTDGAYTLPHREKMTFVSTARCKAPLPSPSARTQAFPDYLGLNVARSPPFPPPPTLPASFILTWLTPTHPVTLSPNLTPGRCLLSARPELPLLVFHGPSDGRCYDCVLTLPAPWSGCQSLASPHFWPHWPLAVPVTQ